MRRVVDDAARRRALPGVAEPVAALLRLQELVPHLVGRGHHQVVWRGRVAVHVGGLDVARASGPRRGLATDDARHQYGLEKLNYPLCYNLPSPAWSLDTDSIQLHWPDSNGLIYIDLLVQLKQGLANATAAQAEQAIAGYNWCIGISDPWHIDRVLHPTARDEGVCLYYSRWPDGYNAVGPQIDLDWRKLNTKRAEFIIGEQRHNKALQFDQTPPELLAFMSEFTTLNQGDLISLGSVICGEQITNTPCQITVIYDKQEWKIALSASNISP